MPMLTMQNSHELNMEYWTTSMLIYKKPFFNSLASCSAHCSHGVGCNSYTWKNGTSSCVLLSTDIKRNFVGPSIPQDMSVYTKYYCSCSEFGYEQINGINGYCFKDNGVKKAYSEAQNTCRNDGGHLVRISTSTKHGHIQSFMNLKSNFLSFTHDHINVYSKVGFVFLAGHQWRIRAYKVCHLFGGLWGIVLDGTNHTDGTWRHSDGSSMFLNWQPGEPNKDFEHCVIMFDDGSHNNIPCDVTRYFICERQLNI